MPVTYVENGSLLHSPAQAIVNPVNCEGVMGAGLAKEFRGAFPAMYNSYKIRCEQGLVRPGRTDLHRHPVDAADGSNRYIINFPTKGKWRKPSEYWMIEAGLQDLVHLSHVFDFSSVALPALGCGKGGLEWRRVNGLIDRYLTKPHYTEYFVYTPK